MAGTIEEIGEGVEGLEVVDEVYGCVGGLADLPGTLAEYIVADADFISRKPKNLSMLWCDPQGGEPYGSMIKLPAGFDGEIRTNSDLFRAIVIQGEVETADASLVAGSYFGSDSPTVHGVHAAGKSESLLYVRTDAPYRVFQD